MAKKDRHYKKEAETMRIALMKIYQSFHERHEKPAQHMLEVYKITCDVLEEVS